MMGDNVIKKDNPDQLRILKEVIEHLEKYHENPQGYEGFSARRASFFGAVGKNFQLESGFRDAKFDRQNRKSIYIFAQFAI